MEKIPDGFMPFNDYDPLTCLLSFLFKLPLDISRDELPGQPSMFADDDPVVVQTRSGLKGR